MRSRLVDGKLIPPASVAVAQVRLRQLDHEIRRLEGDIAGRRPGTLSQEDHRAWRRRAEGNLGWLCEERKQLAAWAEEHAPAREAEDYQEFWRQ